MSGAKRVREYPMLNQATGQTEWLTWAEYVLRPDFRSITCPTLRTGWRIRKAA